MSHEFENDEPQELKRIEQALAGLAAAPPRLDRDRLMFLAGQARVQGTGYRVQGSAGMLWRATSAALAATSLALAVVLLTRPSPPERIVYRDREVTVARAAAQAPSTVAAPPRAFATAPAAAAIPADNYVRSRDVALRLGLDALGNWPSEGSQAESPPPTYRSLLEALSPADSRPSASNHESSQM
jgi:hypothetical protein